MIPVVTSRYQRRLDEMLPEDRAEELLGHITPGDWFPVVCGTEHAVVTTLGDSWGSSVCRLGEVKRDSEEDRQRRINAEFIARAPGLIRELLKKVEKE